MALARARRNESGFNYWPGFVDALSTLVLSIVFLLSVFLVVQFFLSQEVTGKDKALEELNAKLAQLNDLLSLEKLGELTLNDQLAQLRAKHLLVDFPESASLQLNPDLPDNRRCARPWTVKFATDMARAYYARFHQALQINSAVRTVQYQMHLERINGNAAGVDGESASPHLTGQAIDFGKRGMGLAQIAWMRAYLKPLMDAGKLDVEEEFRQACFHISVYRSYLPTRKTPPREVAQLGGASAEQ